MENEIYILEESIDGGKTWRRMTSFKKGDDSRFKIPFDANVAVFEAISYKTYWSSDERKHKKTRDPKDFRVKITINIEL